MKTQQRKASEWLIRVIAILLACFGAMTAPAAVAQTTILTDKGYVGGYAWIGYRVFKGIPYAASTGGSARWKAPQPPSAWTGIRNATAFGSKCPQVSGGTIASSDEDCLNLNVYTPASGSNLPVMVWIHGGGFTTGSGSDYDPTVFVKKTNAIVVTINYRLGALGFLAHPALTAEAADQSSGQYGLQDQQLALKWVKNNIANFGGNPDNVTIFGESAGGISTCAQVASPTAAGLFNKAIIQSGACTISNLPLANGQIHGAAFANNIGCTSATCLRLQPVATLLYNPATQPSAIGPTWGPSFGGVNSVMPTRTLAAIKAGQFNKVPMINGSNHDEFRLFTAIKEVAQLYPLTSAQYVSDVNAYTPNPALVLANYPVVNYSGPNVAHATALGDATFICGARHSNRALTTEGATVYAYEFNDPTAPQLFNDPFMPLLAAHAYELPYLFRIAQAPLTILTPNQQSLSDKMTAYWGNFAKTGNPNGPGLPLWPSYTNGGDQFQKFGSTSVGTINTFNVDHKCDLWESMGF